MNKNNNNCDMIRDLIPLYSEGLCSEESKQIVEEHTKTCDACRSLLTQIPMDTTSESPVPDEGKTFRKVKKKMKRSLLRNIILSVALAAVVIPVGVLTVGEILKIPFVPSFSTVMQSIEVHHQVKQLFSGDIDGYMKRITWAEALDLAGVEIDSSEFEELRRQDTENIRKTYEIAYGEAKVKHIDVKSMHIGSFNTTSAVMTDVTVEFADGRIIDMDFVKELDGFYSAFVMRSGSTPEEYAFAQAVNFADNHRLAPYGQFEYLMTTDGKSLSLNSIRGRTPGILSRFCEEYHERVEKSYVQFYMKDYLVEDCILTLRYDEEQQMLYYETVLVAEDAEGTAILKTKLYHTYKGLIPPTEEDITIYQDGCTDALAKDLAKIFG